MLRISKAAMFAAVLSLSTLPAIGLVDAVAEDATAVDTAVAAPDFKLSIPTITAVGSTMDETALRDALSGGFMKHVDDLAKLNATSITIPEITLTGTTPASDAEPAKQVAITYHDIVLTNIKDGVAESAKIGSSDAKTDQSEFKFGAMTTSTLNFAGILGLYGLVGGTGASDQLQPLYKDFSFDGGTFTAAGNSCTFGKVTTAEFDARPLKVSFAALMDATKKLGASGDTPSPEAMATVVGFMTDIFQAFKSTPVEMAGLSCTGKGDDGTAFDVSMGGLTMDGYQPGIYPALSVKDLKVASGTDTNFTAGELKFKATDLSAPIAAIEAQGSNLTPDWFTGNYRKLIPAFGGLSFANVAIKTANPMQPGEVVDAKIGNFDLTLSDYVNGIPSHIATSASGIDVPLPKDSTDDSVKMLLALGIDRVNLGFDFSAAWDKTTQTINIDKASITGQDLGGMAVAAVLGNATDTLFGDDFDGAAGAAQGLTLKGLTFNITDAGIGDKLVPQLAAAQNMDAASFRSKMAGLAEGQALQALGSNDAARAVGKAIGDFVGGAAKTLTIKLTSKDPAGIPASTLQQAANDPTVMPSVADITAAAQ